MHTISALAIALGEALTPEFAAYAAQVVANAKRLAEKLIGYGFDLVSGGTDNHLILIDLRNKGMVGKPLANGNPGDYHSRDERRPDGPGCRLD
jgi:glycine hydroxymethyltransferase